MAVSPWITELQVIPTAMGVRMGVQRTTKGGLHKLSAIQLRQPLRPGIYMDGGGLRLHVSTSGSMRWVMRIVIDGMRRDIALGTTAVTTLSEARQRAVL